MLHCGLNKGLVALRLNDAGVDKEAGRKGVVAAEDKFACADAIADQRVAPTAVHDVCADDQISTAREIRHGVRIEYEIIKRDGVIHITQLLNVGDGPLHGQVVGS